MRGAVRPAWSWARWIRPTFAAGSARYFKFQIFGLFRLARAFHGQIDGFSVKRRFAGVLNPPRRGGRVGLALPAGILAAVALPRPWSGRQIDGAFVCIVRNSDMWWPRPMRGDVYGKVYGS